MEREGRGQRWQPGKLNRSSPLIRANQQHAVRARRVRAKDTVTTLARATLLRMKKCDKNSWKVRSRIAPTGGRSPTVANARLSR